VPFFYAGGLSDDHLLSPDAAAFPLRLKLVSARKSKKEKLGLVALPGTESDPDKVTANLSPLSRAYIKSLDLPEPDTDQETAELIWFHALAVGYSPAYLSENDDGIRQDWPRIPLPADKDLLLSSVALGRQIAALLDTEKPVPGVTEGKVHEDLRHVAVFERIGGGTANPDEGDLDLTVGWGHAGKGGITMPGKGKIADNGETLDIYLNDRCCWRNVPKSVWSFTIGGYQVIKKWLSYREKSLLGRGLTTNEVRYVTEMARRLKAIVDLQPALDESYRKIAGNTYRWK